MLIEATRHPIRFQLLDGQHVRLIPGQPVELTEKQARTLLEKAPDRVKVVEPSSTSQPDSIIFEPASYKRPVYWETTTGEILGPAAISSMAKVTEEDGRETYWLCVEFGGSWRWIREDRLRSPKRQG